MYSQEQIADQEIQRVKNLCSKFLMIPLNECCFMKYLNKVKMFDYDDKNIFIYYTSQIEGVQN
jgi:hypothetical protein